MPSFHEIYIHPGERTPLPLSLDDFEVAVRRGYPDARVAHGEAGSPVGSVMLAFGSGVETRTAAYNGPVAGLVLWDGNGGIWAEFIVWFLGLLPAEAPVLITTSYDETASLAVSARADEEAIRRLYDTLAPED